jgi:uncharacterized protein (TIGR02266 family)
VVDDTPLIRELATLFLARAGRVLTAATGEAALGLALAVKPEVVFADSSMPGLDGATLCQAIKQHPLLAGTPVVLLTSGPEAEERERAIRAGADDVIAKPIERMALLDAARRLLDHPTPRGLRRIPLRAPAHMRQFSDEWHGLARNLSRGGVFVESPRLLRAREELEVALELPETPELLISTAQVIWTRERALAAGPGMGLRFLGLDRKNARVLAEYVEERLPAQVAPPVGGDVS